MKENPKIIDMKNDPDFRQTYIDEFLRCNALVDKINRAGHSDKNTKSLIEELFQAKLDERTAILPPFNIDLAKNIKLGKHVFINFNFTAIATGNIIIEDDVNIAPNVSIITVQHDYYNRDVILCYPVIIKIGAWICEGAKILPGVIVGENSVVGAGSIVTKDVPDNTVVAGNPARFIKKLD